MKRSLVFLMCCAVGGSGPCVISASSPGNPLVNIGQGRLVVSAEWEHQNRTLDLDVASDVMSNRYWLKGSYGFTEWLDVSGALGGVGFNISTSQNAQSNNYESDHLTFGLGGGLKLRIFRDDERHLAVFGIVNGAHVETEEFRGERPPTDLVWNELQSSISIVRGYGFAFPYVGASYSVVDGELTWNGGSTEDFRDPGGLLFAGVDFALPSRYRLSFEVNGRVGGTFDEISFSVGLSQSTK